jgi:hypothetical protein
MIKVGDWVGCSGKGCSSWVGGRVFSINDHFIHVIAPRASVICSFSQDLLIVKFNCLYMALCEIDNRYCLDEEFAGIFADCLSHGYLDKENFAEQFDLFVSVGIIGTDGKLELNHCDLNDLLFLEACD